MRCWHRALATALLVATLGASVCFAAEDDAPLNELAEALIERMPDGTPFGQFMIGSLPRAADGKPILRFYFAPDPASMEKLHAYSGRWYELVNPHAVSPQIQAWTLEELNREISLMHIEATNDPAQAVVYVSESAFAPRTDGGPRRPDAMYRTVAANTVFLALRSRGALAFINLNSEGNPAFRKIIAEGRGAVVRATMLNEFFNAIGVKDFQNLDQSKLSPATRSWLAEHQAAIDDYTITRSGGPLEDERLKKLDFIILGKLLGR